MTRRVMVTGSREIADQATVSDALEAVQVLVPRARPDDSEIVLVHGAARGADTLAAQVAMRLGWRVEAFPAQWTEHAPGCSAACKARNTCRSAGHRRNQVMVDTAPDVCLAFPAHSCSDHSGSRGTWSAIDKALAAKIPTLVVWRGALWPADETSREWVAEHVERVCAIPGVIGGYGQVAVNQLVVPF